MNFKQLIKTSAAAIATFGLCFAVACDSGEDPNPNPNPNPNPDPDPTPGIVDLEKDLDLKLSRCHAQYYGDYYQNGTANYAIFCYDAAQSDARLRLDLIGPALDQTPSSILTEGTYEIGTETTEFHCLAGSMAEGSAPEGSWYENSKTNEVGWLASGTIKITESEGLVYTFEVDAKTNLGYTIKGTYTGGVILAEETTHTPASTLVGDKVLNNLPTSGIYTFYGDVMQIGLGYTIIDIKAEGPGNPGFAIAILQADPAARELVPGTYAVSNRAKANVLYPGMVNNGAIEPTAYYEIGTATSQNGVQAPVQAGYIKLEKLDGSNWQIEFDTYDDANNHITGTWAGTLSEQAA